MKIFLILISTLFILSCSSDLDRRDQSPNFKDGVFHNDKKSDGKSFWTFIKMRFQEKWNDWPQWIEIKDNSKPKLKVTSSKITITHINHSTFLIQTQGLNILTDPIYSERCSPVSFAGPKRVHQPAIKFKNLPPIDLIIISHDHYDHLDLETIENLIKRDNPQIYTGLGVARRIEGSEKSIEMDWWDFHQFNEKLKVNFVQVQHFSGRTLTDRNTTLWGGYVLEFKDKKIYFGGDSGYADHYQETYKRFGAMDVSLLPIGAYAPRWFMKYAHMNPAEAVRAHLDLKSKQSFGMHYGTFQLTAEKIEEPQKLLLEETKKANLNSEEFITLKLGNPKTIK